MEVFTRPNFNRHWYNVKLIDKKQKKKSNLRQKKFWRNKRNNETVSLRNSETAKQPFEK